jgi:hypothetical protein
MHNFLFKIQFGNNLKKEFILCLQEKKYCKEKEEERLYLVV